jgi:multicomponent Na+:H+ antiporter subunit E
VNVRIIIFIVSLAVWLGLTWSVNVFSVIIGIGVSVFVTSLISDMFVKKILVKGKAVLWFFYYIPLLFWECMKANLDVAYRVIHPGLPVNPGIVKVKTKLRSELGLTFLANSITLTPGTLSVDVDKENGCLYVHWIDVKDKEIEGASRIIVRRFEKVLGRIFE